jgi:hypothetical protein
MRTHARFTNIRIYITFLLRTESLVLPPANAAMSVSLVFSLLIPVAVGSASITLNSTATVTIPGFVPHVVASDNNRSIFSIVWSCVATLFACAWVAVHPDIPGLDDEGFDHFFHRMKLLIWVLLSPEAILVWAWRQHRGAQALRYMFNQPTATGKVH